jgi:hypothetical protein
LILLSTQLASQSVRYPVGSGTLSVWPSQWLHPRSPQVSCSVSPLDQLCWFSGRMLACYLGGLGLILSSTQLVSQSLHHPVGSGTLSVWSSQWIHPRSLKVRCSASPYFSPQSASLSLNHPVGSGYLSAWQSQWIHPRSPQVCCSSSPFFSVFRCGSGSGPQRISVHANVSSVSEKRLSILDVQISPLVF